MRLTLDIPDDIAARLAAAHGDLGRAALGWLALDGYRAGALSRYQVQRLLGLGTRWEAEEWLGARWATAQYTAADLDQDRAALDRLLGPANP
ncbi:MAG: UPF0175 family protein [Gemmataceae bacterium]|nr:UPF0175 family protein [Gemmataceae bacterium]